MAVETQIPQVKAMQKTWEMIDALESTAKMRAARKAFLPQWPSEKDKEYDFRLNMSFLYPVFNDATFTIAGRVFREPVTYETTNDQLEGLAKDVDREGKTLTEYGHFALWQAAKYGAYHVLVDFDEVPENQDGPVTDGISLARQQELNLRPYWVGINPRQLIGWREEGSEIVQFRYWEMVDVPKIGATDEYDIEQVKQIRVINPDSFEIWQQRRDSQGRLVADDSAVKSSAYELILEGPRTLGRIGLCSIYTGIKDGLIAAPPMMDLAYKNVQHWISSSDQTHILHLCRAPMIFASGIAEREDGTPGGPPNIGSNRIWAESAPDADAKYLEISGPGIEAGERDLKELERQMNRMAREPMVPATGNMTATQRAYDQWEADSPLQAWSEATESFLQSALDVSAEWLEKENDAEVSVNKDFGKSGDDDNAKVKNLIEMESLGLIRHETFLMEIKEMNYISEDVEIEGEVESREMGEMPPAIPATPVDPEINAEAA